MPPAPASLTNAERTAVTAALAEDRARDDLTTQALVPIDASAVAEIRAKAPGVVAGIAVAAEVFRQVDASLRVEHLAGDGETVPAGRIVLRARGCARSLLEAERTAVNFLQRMSGIATLTARFVEAVRGTGVRILATRKTAPGLRPFDLAAVRAGGGGVHRESLAAAVLVKGNHVRAACAAGTAATMADVVARVVAAAAANAQSADSRSADARGADDSSAARPAVGIEAEDLDEFRVVLRCAAAGSGPPRVDVILLDNFTPEQCAEAVRLRAGAWLQGGGPALEASGGITLANVAAYARSGVERISVGALTHSVPALDLSMRISG